MDNSSLNQDLTTILAIGNQVLTVSMSTILALFILDQSILSTSTEKLKLLKKEKNLTNSGVSTSRNSVLMNMLMSISQLTNLFQKTAQKMYSLSQLSKLKLRLHSRWLLNSLTPLQIQLKDLIFTITGTMFNSVMMIRNGALKIKLSNPLLLKSLNLLHQQLQLLQIFYLRNL